MSTIFSSRRTGAAALFLVALQFVAQSAFSQTTLEVSKVHPQVISTLQHSGRVEVLIRIDADEVIRQSRNRTDEIYSDTSLSSIEKNKRNDANQDALKNSLMKIKADAIPEGSIQGLMIIGSVTFGPELIAVITMPSALEKLEKIAAVKFIGLNGRVFSQ